MAGRAAALVIALLALAGPGGCGGGDGGAGGAAGEPPGVSTRPAPDRRSPPPASAGEETTVQEARCPPSAAACAAAEGRIVYVERIDPDGDGDAHFVIVDLPGITLPGLTAIDVRKGLRPDPLPGPGDLISAAGPVQTGSQGQSQIHAVELHVGRPRRSP
jgi:hypothetical protein